LKKKKKIKFQCKSIENERKFWMTKEHRNKRITLFRILILTSSHDKTGFYLKRGSDILKSIYPARVRIWVISTVIAPNKHISCKSCSSRTGPSVTATMIAGFWSVYSFCLNDFLSFHSTTITKKNDFLCNLKKWLVFF
jgi:hypothetical protein